MLLFSTLLAVLLYGAASLLQYQVVLGKRTAQPALLKWLALGGFVAHTLSVYTVLHQPQGLNLSLFSAGSLIAWLVTGLVLLSSLRQAIDNLFLGVLPMALITALLTIVTDLQPGKPYAGGLIAHILLSILAYSVFTIAVIQAILLSRQEAALKHHHTRGLIASLPPLQTMERFLFELLWAGLILLTASLVTGFLFEDNLFAQHLVHKTVLSIMAWGLYATLLFGRLSFGWRSHTAIRWTLGSFALLALGYFGSKFVTELILHS
ncbi:cytochrome C assembly family protein [Pontibacter sp. JAM-7]|uniref:cytochrome C assembly family protein n=1 Tax=Pontibacter sp. JAM-7 TaxID=3366581 RepID=UPI003AF567F4